VSLAFLVLRLWIELLALVGIQVGVHVDVGVEFLWGWVFETPTVRAATTVFFFFKKK
jgi:hypothetical protein